MSQIDLSLKRGLGSTITYHVNYAVYLFIHTSNTWTLLVKKVPESHNQTRTEIQTHAARAKSEISSNMVSNMVEFIWIPLLNTKRYSPTKRLMRSSKSCWVWIFIFQPRQMAVISLDLSLLISCQRAHEEHKRLQALNENQYKWLGG